MYEDQETKALTPIMGERPRGYQIATPDGRWLARRRRRPHGAGDRRGAGSGVPHHDLLLRPLSVEGSTITTKVDVAWNESWVGGEQVRYIRFEGDKLFIESPPMPHPNMYGKIAGHRGLAARRLVSRRDRSNLNQFVNLQLFPSERRAR